MFGIDSSKINKYRSFSEICISAILFIFLIYNGVLFSKFDFFQLVYASLAYIVILELIRMISDYILIHHIKISVIIDTFIIFILREIILTFSDKNMTEKFINLFTYGEYTLILNQKIFYILIGVFVISFLFLFRKWSLQHSLSFKIEKESKL